MHSSDLDFLCAFVLISIISLLNVSGWEAVDRKDRLMMKQSNSFLYEFDFLFF